MNRFYWRIKTSIKNKIILAFFLIGLAVSVLFSVIYYQVSKKSLMNDLKERLFYSAQLASLSIEVKELERILKKIKPDSAPDYFQNLTEDQDFKSFIERLEKIKNQNHPLFMDAFVIISSPNEKINEAFFNLQILGRISGKTEKKDGIYFGDLVKIIKPDKLRNLIHQRKNESGMFQLDFNEIPDSKGIENLWVSYTQLYDTEKKNVIGLFCLEIQDPNFTVSLKRILMFSWGICLALLCVSLIASFFLGFFFTKGIRQLNEGVKKFFHKDFKHRINIKTADEIGQLSLVLNRFAEEIDHYSQSLQEKNIDIRKQLLDSVHILSSLLASSSTRLYEITQNVTKISIMIGKKLRFSEEELEHLEIACRLHDLGMIGETERILASGRNLTREEVFLIQNHPVKSVEIIKWLDHMKDVKKIISQHHEKFDGSGYPFGLKGAEIILGARIIGLVDDFVMLLSNREFQNFDKKTRIIEYLKEKKGILYDPVIVDLLIALIEEEKLIYIPNENDIIMLQENGWTFWQIPSNIHFEPILVRKIMEKLKAYSLNEDQNFSIDYSLAEVIRNAIIHGNKYNESKKVSVYMKIEELKNKKIKLILKVRDEGEGLNIDEHNRFSEIRRKLFQLIDEMKDYQSSRRLEKEDQFSQIVDSFNQFKTSYYSDFNAYRQKEAGNDLTGGLGLLYVKKAFDNVVFKHILFHDKITGTEVVMEKTIQLKSGKDQIKD